MKALIEGQPFRILGLQLGTISSPGGEHPGGALLLPCSSSQEDFEAYQVAGARAGKTSQLEIQTPGGARLMRLHVTWSPPSITISENLEVVASQYFTQVEALT